MGLLVASIWVAAVALALLVCTVVLWTSQRRDRRARDAEVHFREELFDILANNTDDVYLVINADGTAADYVSPNIERIIGTRRADAMADFYSIQKPTYIDSLEPTRENLLSVETDVPKINESVRTHKVTGEVKTFKEKTYRMSIDGEEHIFVIISDRTKEISQMKALQEALASAEAANEAKTTFLGNVSHDIRTPMNAIIGVADLIDDNTSDPEFVKSHIGKIKAASRHMLGLINDVLDMSKIENGATLLNSGPFRLSEMTDELERVISPQAEAKGQHLVFRVDENLPDLYKGDRMRVTQVFMNLLSNAVKYTGEGGTILFQAGKASSGPSGDVVNVRFVVMDDGIGISEGFLEHIFEPFARERKSVVSEMQGTGLGMPIAKSLVEMMGGTIGVKSAVGEGSTFTVDLPLRRLEGETAPKERPHPVDIGGMNFLVAEDIEINAEVIAEQLASMDATCSIARNGREAVEMFTESAEGFFDAVLMDVQMPEMNGYEATREIRASGHADAREIPIVAMTANAFVEDVNDAIEAGMDAHLAKPASIAQICETLGEVGVAPKRRSSG